VIETKRTISVILVNYNGRQHLDPCLRSLARQDYPADLVDVIMVEELNKKVAWLEQQANDARRELELLKNGTLMRLARRIRG
jgi:GT2 family glycosyltransferase